MTDEEFAKFLGHLAEAEAALNDAHLLMDGSIGFAAGGENGLRAAFSAIAVVRDIEVAWHKQHPGATTFRATGRITANERPHRVVRTSGTATVRTSNSPI